MGFSLGLGIVSICWEIEEQFSSQRACSAGIRRVRAGQGHMARPNMLTDREYSICWVPELTHCGYAMESALLSISGYCWIPLVTPKAAVLLCILDSSIALGRPLNSAWDRSILKAYAELAHPLPKAVIGNREISMPRLATPAWIGAQSGNTSTRSSRSEPQLGLLKRLSVAPPV